MLPAHTNQHDTSWILLTVSHCAEGCTDTYAAALHGQIVGACSAYMNICTLTHSGACRPHTTALYPVKAGQIQCCCHACTHSRATQEAAQPTCTFRQTDKHRHICTTASEGVTAMWMLCYTSCCHALMNS